MKKNEMTYMESVHRDGRAWGIVIAILLFAFPAVLMAIFNTVPEWNSLVKGLIATAPMYWAVGIVEIFT